MASMSLSCTSCQRIRNGRRSVTRAKMIAEQRDTEKGSLMRITAKRPWKRETKARRNLGRKRLKRVYTIPKILNTAQSLAFHSTACDGWPFTGSISRELSLRSPGSWCNESGQTCLVVSLMQMDWRSLSRVNVMTQSHLFDHIRGPLSIRSLCQSWT